MTRLVPLSLILLSAVLPASAAGLGCTGPAGGHLGAQTVCAALAPLLGAKAEGVRLELSRDEPNILSGRLIWGNGQGPSVEVTSSDRPLDGRAAARLARGLLQVSDLP